MTQLNPIITIEDLSVRLNGSEIIKNLSSKIPMNKITVVVGPSGAGKSTLLKCMARFYPFDGNICYQGESVTDIEVSELRRDMVYVDQIPVVFSGTVLDNLMWGREIWAMGDDYSPQTAIEEVGLPPSILDQDAETLSVGQKQRLHLARSLAIKPRVLLLDEPASSLDAISRDEFEQLIIKLMGLQSDLTVVMVTHDLDQAKRLADYAILLVEGRKHMEDEASTFFDKVKDLDQAETLRELIKGETSK